MGAAASAATAVSSTSFGQGGRNGKLSSYKAYRQDKAKTVAKVTVLLAGPRSVVRSKRPTETDTAYVYFSFLDILLVRRTASSKAENETVEGIGCEVDGNLMAINFLTYVPTGEVGTVRAILNIRETLAGLRTRSQGNYHCKAGGEGKEIMAFGDRLCFLAAT